MDAVTSTGNNIRYYANNNYQHVKEKVHDNSTQMTIDGSAGLATFGVIRNSGKIGNNVVRAIENSKAIKVDKQAKILKIISKCKHIAKFANNPVVKGTAGVLGGLSAATALVGSTAKIADTCSYLQGLNPHTNNYNA